MKHKFKGYYAIYKSDNEPVISSITYQRKTCIENWVKDIDMSWEEIKKYGLTCRKVNVEITTHSV